MTLTQRIRLRRCKYELALAKTSTQVPGDVTRFGLVTFEDLTLTGQDKCPIFGPCGEIKKVSTVYLIYFQLSFVEQSLTHI